MKDKTKKVFETKEVLVLVIITLIIGFTLGYLTLSLTTKNLKFGDKHLNEIIENYQYIVNNHYPDVNKKDLVNGAIKGMVEIIDDDYANYFDGIQQDNFDKLLTGYYEGVGIEVVTINEDIFVSKVFPNSPAATSGFKVGDKITALNEISAIGKKSEDIVNYIKDNKEKDFVFSITRENKEYKIRTQNGKVTIPSVISNTLSVNNKKIGYIKIDIFALNTADQFKQELKKLANGKINSLIIDVRDNSGGQLDSVKEITALFLNKRDIMYQLKQSNKTTKYYSNNQTKINYPVIILGNGQSASASELLIAALKENDRATFVGEATFGKGTAQQLKKTLTGDEYKITTQEWLTPKGNSINGKGVTPDIRVKNIKQDDESVRDLQLEKALEILEK